MCTFQKDPKKMKPLMITLMIQPLLTLPFYGIYTSIASYRLNEEMILLYVFLTILDLYFAFCIKNLLKNNGYESEVINNISYESVENLDDVTFDVSSPN
jgi:hypothetical protein